MEKGAVKVPPGLVRITFFMSVCGYGEEGATLGTKESKFIKEITCVWTLKDG